MCLHGVDLIWAITSCHQCSIANRNSYSPEGGFSIQLRDCFWARVCNNFRVLKFWDVYACFELVKFYFDWLKRSLSLSLTLRAPLRQPRPQSCLDLTERNTAAAVVPRQCYSDLACFSKIQNSTFCKSFFMPNWTITKQMKVG